MGAVPHRFLGPTEAPFLGRGKLLDELSELAGEPAFLPSTTPNVMNACTSPVSPSRRSVQFVPQLYTWLPLHATASAMAILAHRSEEERQGLDGLGLPLFTGPRKTPRKIEKIMASIRSEGFALSAIKLTWGRVPSPPRYGPLAPCRAASESPCRTSDSTK